MNMRLVAFALAGALFASTAVNVRLLSTAPSACPLCAPPSAAAVQNCIECLALTPQQHAALLQQCATCCGPDNDVEQRITELRGQLLASLRAAPIDAGAVRALGQQLAALRTEAIVAGVETALRVRSVLTPEQVTTLEQTLGKAEYR
jgi:Spy/CpxP family protein refolding chaperone